MAKANRKSTRTTFYRAAGRRLKITRLALGVSEGEAAAAYGVSLQTYRGYEAGKPQRGMSIMGFVDKFNVSIDWLIAGDVRGLGSHLAKNSQGKVAILPIALWESGSRRRARARRLPA